MILQTQRNGLFLLAVQTNVIISWHGEPPSGRLNEILSCNAVAQNWEWPYVHWEAEASERGAVLSHSPRFATYHTYQVDVVKT
jgi:hypothetical protein